MDGWRPITTMKEQEESGVFSVRVKVVSAILRFALALARHV